MRLDVILNKLPGKLSHLLQRVEVRSRHGEHHPLLRLADPDLGVRQAVVLERRVLEVHRRTNLGAHLTHGGAEAAGATVGDRAEEGSVARVSRTEDRVAVKISSRSPLGK